MNVFRVTYLGVTMIFNYFTTMWKIGEVRNKPSNFKMKSYKTYWHCGILLYFWHYNKIRTYLLKACVMKGRGMKLLYMFCTILYLYFNLSLEKHNFFPPTLQLMTSSLYVYFSISLFYISRSNFMCNFSSSKLFKKCYWI